MRHRHCARVRTHAVRQAAGRASHGRDRDGPGHGRGAGSESAIKMHETTRADGLVIHGELTVARVRVKGMERVPEAARPHPSDGTAATSQAGSVTSTSLSPRFYRAWLRDAVWGKKPLALGALAPGWRLPARHPGLDTVHAQAASPIDAHEPFTL